MHIAWGLLFLKMLSSCAQKDFISFDTKKQVRTNSQNVVGLKKLSVKNNGRDIFQTTKWNNEAENEQGKERVDRDQKGGRTRKKT